MLRPPERFRKCCYSTTGEPTSHRIAHSLRPDSPPVSGQASSSSIAALLTLDQDIPESSPNDKRRQSGSKKWSNLEAEPRQGKGGQPHGHDYRENQSR